MFEELNFMLCVRSDNKLYTDYPTDSRYYLTISRDLFIELLEQHYADLDIVVRVVKVLSEPLIVVCRYTLEDIEDFEIGMMQVQQIAYAQNWYCKVANVLLTKV